MPNNSKVSIRRVKKRSEEKEYDLLTLHRSAAMSSLTALSAKVSVLRAVDASARDLLDHTKGFYEEIDKLAKGKSMLEVTDRALLETNWIICDAKRVVGSDPYLGRTHEFIAAGNNPVYPDVLLALRSVLQSLERFLAKVVTELGIKCDTDRELTTILAAMELLLEGEEVVSKEMLARRMGKPPSQKWIVSHGYNDWHFDFEQFIKVGSPIVTSEAQVQLALGNGE